MKCPEVHALMMAWLDSELDTRATVEVSGHLETCGPCRTRFEAEERLEQGVAERLRDERMPADVWARVGAVPGRRRASSWRWVAAASSLLLVLTLALKLTPHPNELMAEMAARHRAMVAGRAGLDLVTGEGEPLRAWLAARRLEGLAPGLPGLVDHHDMQLLGAREERLLGQGGVAVALRCCGVPTTLFLMRRERADALPVAWREALDERAWSQGDSHARAGLGDEWLVGVVWEGGHPPPALDALARL